MMTYRCHVAVVSVAAFWFGTVARAPAAYAPVVPRPLRPGEVAVTQPGVYAEPGTTYVLTRNVTASRTAIFLGKDAILDLNGHTLTFADAGYEHVPNYSFEEGLKDWDTTRAPGAKVVNTRWTHHLVGDHACILPRGEELVSPYINLPEADRAYYAMVAVAKRDMHVGVYVEGEDGRTVKSTFRWGNNVRPCCPEARRGPKLGGGTVFALMCGHPAGKYRIRVKAVQGDCVIDAVDIRPAMDVGVGIVGKTMPWAYYKCILDGDTAAFFDYAGRDEPGRPVKGVPHVTGKGTVRIRGGVIKSGSRGIRSWCIQSTARDVRLVLENVRFVTSGINAHR